jgi:ferrous iron transport protein A
MTALLIPLNTMAPGQRGRVVQVHGPPEIRHRLMEMGLTTGADVYVVRVAPLGDPIELQVRGYRLSIRKSEAALLTIDAA